MSLYSRFFKESQALARLSLPIILSQVAYVLLGLLDTIMSGQAGSADQAAVALGVAFWVPLFFTLTSVLQAVSPLVAHHFGAGNMAGIVHDTREGMWLSVFAGALSIALLPTARPLMAALEIDAALIDKTHVFLLGIAVGLPAAMLFRVLSYYSASINQTQPMMILAFLGLGVNALFNWLLIWGHWGLPALGGAGCGWATAIGMWVALLALAGWTAWAPAYRACYLWHGWSWPHWETIRKLLKIGIPMGIAALAEVGAFSSVALLVGRFGAEQIAAHQVALNFSSVIFMIPVGLSTALSIRVGQTLGAGDARGARFIAWSGIALGLLIAVCAIPLILFGREAIVSFYSPDRNVQIVAANLMLFTAIWQLADAAQVTAIGALRGYKVTLPPMLMMLVAFWLIGLPVGAWLGYKGMGSIPPQGIYGFWIGLVTGLILVSAGLTFTLRKVSWASLHTARAELA